MPDTGEFSLEQEFSHSAQRRAVKHVISFSYSANRKHRMYFVFVLFLNDCICGLLFFFFLNVFKIKKKTLINQIKSKY